MAEMGPWPKLVELVELVNGGCPAPLSTDRPWACGAIYTGRADTVDGVAIFAVSLATSQTQI